MSKQIKQSKEINVGLGSGFIPVNIGGLDFKLLTSDRKRKEYYQVLEELGKEQKQLIEATDKKASPSTNEKVYDQTVEIISKTIDTVLGKNAFHQLYEKAGEDVEAVLEAFIEVMNQYQRMQEKNKLQQYVDGKKK
ncbi:hypothetical protein ACYSNR_10810 [Enterococcus sp. LJL128]